MFSFETRNICIFSRKATKIMDNMVGTKINFTCLLETKWTSKMVKELYDSKVKLYYTHTVRTRNEAGIIIQNECKKDIVAVKRVKGHIITPLMLLLLMLFTLR